jgi:hypothetical protein
LCSSQFWRQKVQTTWHLLWQEPLATSHLSKLHHGRSACGEERSHGDTGSQRLGRDQSWSCITTLSQELTGVSQNPQWPPTRLPLLKIPPPTCSHHILRTKLPSHELVGDKSLPSIAVTISCHVLSYMISSPCKFLCIIPITYGKEIKSCVLSSVVCGKQDWPPVFPTPEPSLVPSALWLAMLLAVPNSHRRCGAWRRGTLWGASHGWGTPGSGIVKYSLGWGPFCQLHGTRGFNCHFFVC